MNIHHEDTKATKRRKGAEGAIPCFFVTFVSSW